MERISLEEIFNSNSNCHSVHDIKDEEPFIKKSEFIRLVKETSSKVIELAAEKALHSFWGMYDYHGDHDCFTLDADGLYKFSFIDENGQDVELSLHFDKQEVLDLINKIWK